MSSNSRSKCEAAAATFEPWAFLQLCDEETGLLEYPKKDDNAPYKCATCRGVTLPCTNNHVRLALVCVNVLITPILLMIHAVKICEWFAAACRPLPPVKRFVSPPAVRASSECSSRSTSRAARVPAYVLAAWVDRRARTYAQRD